MTPGVNGCRLVQQHAVEVFPGRVSRTTVCKRPYDRYAAADWEDPRSRMGGNLCQDCLNVTGAQV